MKKYLNDGDRLYSTGCWIVYDKEKNCFIFDGIEDDTFYDGEFLEFDINGKPYIEK